MALPIVMLLSALLSWWSFRAYPNSLFSDFDEASKHSFHSGQLSLMLAIIPAGSWRWGLLLCRFAVQPANGVNMCGKEAEPIYAQGAPPGMVLERNFQRRVLSAVAEVSTVAQRVRGLRLQVLVGCRGFSKVKDNVWVNVPRTEIHTTIGLV